MEGPMTGLRRFWRDFYRAHIAAPDPYELRVADFGGAGEEPTYPAEGPIFDTTRMMGDADEIVRPASCQPPLKLVRDDDPCLRNGGDNDARSPY